tara:strand:- start:50 stop:379 length:330 start_codon:yes stop_codon:yes gene_type:complete
MPNLPKAKTRWWIPKKKQEARQVDNSKFYQSKQWRATRNYYIQANPLCEECKRNGKTKGGQCVDHIKPISKGGHQTDYSNLQTLCNKCHAKKSGQEGAEYRNNIKLRNG